MDMDNFKMIGGLRIYMDAIKVATSDYHVTAE